MDKRQISERISLLFADVEGNTLTERDKIQKKYAGTVMFDAPIVGFGSADDALFEEYKKSDIIGPWHMSPNEWLGGAKTVVSLFFPITEQVRKSNYDTSLGIGSKQWAYARIDGQAYIGRYMAELKKWFEQNGIRACVPAIDERFGAVKKGKGITGYAEIDKTTYGSRWSERHAAYVCGLGTFVLSKGLITVKGIAGRFASIIIDLPLEADTRPYTGIYDYCINCGACVRRCPAKAIDIVTGKDHVKCHGNVIKSGVIHYPRYGCGLCQTKVPCESGLPLKYVQK